MRLNKQLVGAHFPVGGLFLGSILFPEVFEIRFNCVVEPFFVSVFFSLFSVPIA